MELIDLVPEFNLYEEFWRIYTKSNEIPPQYIAPSGVVSRSIVGEGCEIYGEVYNSVISPGVIIEEGAVVSDSIIMNKAYIGRNSKLYKVIMAENAKVGINCELGVGEEKENKSHPNIYCNGLVTLGEGTVIPDNIRIGKNTVISGITKSEDYQNNWLDGGECLIKGGVNR